MDGRSRSLLLLPGAVPALYAWRFRAPVVVTVGGFRCTWVGVAAACMKTKKTCRNPLDLPSLAPALWETRGRIQRLFVSDVSGGLTNTTRPAHSIPPTRQGCGARIVECVVLAVCVQSVRPRSPGLGQ